MKCERAHRKLDEARFFYHHLVQERKVDVINEPEAFGFYFSAFIQAARSVTWVVGKEEPEKWKAWEPEWKRTLTEEEVALLDFTNERRIDEVHRGGTEKLIEWEYVAIDELLPKPAASHHPSYYQHLLRSPFGFHPSAFRGRRVFYLQDGAGKQEVINLCDR